MNEQRCRVLASFTTVALFLAAGCSGSASTPASCGTLTPCGGNLVGSWDIKQACLSGDFSIEQCPDAKFDASGVKVGGNITFNADPLGYSSIQTFSGTLAVALPTACLIIFDCVIGLPAVLNSELDKQEGGNPFSSIACAQDGTTCNCKLALKALDANETGSYQTAGNTVTMTPKGATESDTAQYCVAGTELRMEIPMNMGMGSSGMLSASDLKGQIMLSKK